MGVRGITNISSGGASGGGLTQEEHDALMSMASMPARGDVNPEKSTLFPTIIGNSYNAWFPIIGFDKVSVMRSVTNITQAMFADSAGATISTITLPSANTWSDYIDVPSNAMFLKMYAGSGNGTVHYSLLTADSPYNPDNQTP